MSDTSMEEVAKRLTREQLNAIIPKIANESKGLLDALTHELTKIPRLAISLWLSDRHQKFTAIEIAQSLDDKILPFVTLAVEFEKGDFKQTLLYELMARACAQIRQAQAEGNLIKIMSVLTPFELLMYMHYSAEAFALRDNPELEGEELAEAAREIFKGFFREK